MHWLEIKLALVVIFAVMYYFIIRRFIYIFHGILSKWIVAWLAITIWVVCMLTFIYNWENKILDIMWTLASWLFVFWFLLFLILLIELWVSTWYSISPWIIVFVIIIFFWLWAFFSLHTKITSLDIQSDKIQKDVKILLISDIHVDNIFSKYHLSTIQKKIMEEQPDLVLIAWDMLNKPNIQYIEYYKWFWYKENIPIIAVVWNHDVMWDNNIVYNISKTSNIQILKNQSITIGWIQIIWLNDKSQQDSSFSLEDIISSSNIVFGDKSFNILLTHQPIWLEKLDNYPIDLEVAWHTHNGQFFWLRKFVATVNDYWYGKYEHNNKLAFVTQWIWTRWLPFRLWTQSEIVLINIKKK